MSYTYSAHLRRVVDGDTLDLTVDLGFHLTASLRFRLFGIDAPEMVGTSKAAGLAAKEALSTVLAVGPSGMGLVGPLRIVTYKGDSFGRWVADVFFNYAEGDEVHVNSYMVERGHAVWKTYT